MTSAEGIRKLGFRRWYERQLIEGHMYFVTCFLSLILLAASLEQFDVRGPVLQQLWIATLVVGAAVVCVKALRWYQFILARAEALGAQSSCAKCNVYGVLQVLAAGDGDPSTAGRLRRPDNPWIRVRCKKCGHEWRLENT